MTSDTTSDVKTETDTDRRIPCAERPVLCENVRFYFYELWQIWGSAVNTKWLCPTPPETVLQYTHVVVKKTHARVFFNCFCVLCVLCMAKRYILAKVSEGINRNLPARNTLVQLLALYTNPESHNAQRYRQTEGRHY